jgi:hypothetical protein
MKVLQSVVIESARGEQVLVFICRNLKEQDILHHYLRIDAFELKKNISETRPQIEYLSTGQRKPDGRMSWRRDFIELPKWYDLN